VSDLRSELGQRGEKLAEGFLRKQGMKTVARRYRTPVGELDLVMREGETIVFVEVKTQRDTRYQEPQERVRADKRRKLLKAARWFVAQKPWADPPCRFDIVAVTLPEVGEPRIVHFADAFVPQRW